MAPLTPCALLATLFASAAAAPPNILFLMADQLRADYITPAFTPHLAALAARGLTLSSTYSAVPSCTPARSALLTGRSPWYNGMLGYGALPLAWPVEMPRVMAEQGGYTTACVGKNHYIPDGWPANVTPPSHGWAQQSLYDGLGNGMGSEEFDTYDAWFRDESGGKDPLATGKPNMDWNSWRGAPYVYREAWHPTAWVGSTASAFLQNFSATRDASTPPFFLKVSWHRPHSPYDPPGRLLNTTPASQLPPMFSGSGWDDKYAGPSKWCGPSDADAWCGEMPPDVVETSRRAYLASVKFVDEHVGALLDTLDALDLSKDTWVLFVSDHGDGQGEHHLWRKTFPFELSARVPGIIAWPRGASAAVPPGSSTPLLAELRDIFPTVLDLAGVPSPIPLNGTSWACLARKDPTGVSCGAGGGAWRTQLDLEHSTIFNSTNHWSALVEESGLKYIFWATSGEEMLFNISSDPHEMHDLSSEPPFEPHVTRLRLAMGAQFMREGRGPSWVDASRGTPVIRPSGQVYSPLFPTPPPPHPQPPIAPCDAHTVWETTSGGYYRSCGGESGNLAPFSGLSLEQARARCCALPACAGVNYDAASRSGLLKTNAMCGWIASDVFIGSDKPGQACHTCS